MPHVVLLGTMDTKSKELLYLRTSLIQSQLVSHSVQVTLIDCGRDAVYHPAIDISIPGLHAPPDSLDRAQTIEFLTARTEEHLRDLIDADEVHGVLSAGGSGGTSLASAAMRAAVRIGVPKLIVSTMASGSTDSIVGESDITLMYPIVDITGMNSLLTRILGNAAGAIVGMALAYETSLRTRIKDEKLLVGRRRKVGITMFGVTTPCVNTIQEYLERHHPDIEVFVFHATGHGGRAMERMIQDNALDAALDITTTEIADALVGGAMSAGTTRLEAALQRGIPYIVSVGAVDMVNFGPLDTVPPAFRDRKLLRHNGSVTLMRTSKEETIKIGGYIARKVTCCAARPDAVQVWLPRGGVSSLSVRGAIFEDDETNKTLCHTLRNALEGSDITLVEDERDINDKTFAMDLAQAFVGLLDKSTA